MNDKPCPHKNVIYDSYRNEQLCTSCFKKWYPEEAEPCMLNHTPYCALPHYPPTPWPWIVTNNGTGVKPNPWQSPDIS